MTERNLEIVVIDEAQAKASVSRVDAFLAVKKTFAAMAAKSARNFRVIREALEDQGALYGFKSGYDAQNGNLGLKAGGYWPRNSESGLDNHQSSVLLFEPQTGRLEAVVSGNYLTATRTAAAMAVSADTLARKDVAILSIVGAGKQAEFQLRAAVEVRAFSRILIANRTSAKAEALAKKVSDIGVEVYVVSIEEACREADVLITIVSAFEAVVKSEWIQPGTHIAAMGTDTVGKQELAAELFKNARIFTDEVPQSVHLGEAQHAVSSGLIQEADVTPIGMVINGAAEGRLSSSDITIFDGTGVGLQDLAVARLALDSVRGS